jgi:hypothetical protein
VAGPQGAQGFTGATGATGSAPSVAVRDNGTLISTRSTLNFIDGTGIGITVTDDSANSRADITVAISPTVTIRTASGTVGSTVGAVLTVRAACNTGEVAVGGGYSGPGYPNYYVTRPVNSSNGTTGTPTKWEVSIENTVAGQSPAVSAWVVCLAV